MSPTMTARIRWARLMTSPPRMGLGRWPGRGVAGGPGRPGWGRSRGRRSRPSEAVLIADWAAPAGRPTLTTLLGAGAGQLPAAGGTGRDPDAAQQMQGRLRMPVGRVG